MMCHSVLYDDTYKYINIYTQQVVYLLVLVSHFFYCPYFENLKKDDVSEYDYYSPFDLFIKKSKFNNLKEEILLNDGNEFNGGQGI